VSAHRHRDVALVVIIGVFWGLNWPAVKTILGEIPPWTLRALGFTLGAVLLAGLARACGQSLLPQRSQRWPLTVAGLLTVFGFNVLTAFGQLHTQTSRAAIIAFTMPMWAAALSVAFLGERMSALRAASLALGMLGLAALLQEDFAGLLRDPVGPLCMLGAALSWAAGTVALKRREWSVRPIARAAWMVGCSAPPAIAAAFIAESPASIPWPSATVALVLAYHVLFPMVVCHAAWVSLVGGLPASVAAIGTLLIPVVGVFSAIALLGEPMTTARLVALALVLSSIALTFARRPGARG